MQNDTLEWVKINQHLQSVGTATCDVSHLILQADILRSEDKNNRAAEMLMNAARDTLAHRKLARKRAAALAAKQVGRHPKLVKNGKIWADPRAL